MARNSENIAAAITAANNVIAQQGEALDELSTLLEGKAAGGKTLKWIKVHESTLTENARSISVSTDENGKAISEYNPLGISLVVSTPADSTQTNNNGQVWVYPQAISSDNSIRIISAITGWKTIARDSIWMWQGGGFALAFNGNNNGASPLYKTNNYVMNGVYAYINDTGDHFPAGTQIRVSLLAEM